MCNVQGIGTKLDEIIKEEHMLNKCSALTETMKKSRGNMDTRKYIFIWKIHLYKGVPTLHRSTK